MRGTEDQRNAFLNIGFMSCPLVPAELSPNIARMLWDTAERTPEQDAIVERTDATQYRQLRRMAAAAATRLRTQFDLAESDRVAVLATRGAASAAAFFGIAAAGGVTVMVNETLRPRQIEHILRHCDARALVAERALLDGLPRALEWDGRVAELIELVDTQDETATIAEPVPLVGNDVAEIIYTSGSTGLPKGVTITHANLWAGVRAVTSYVGITDNDRIASLLPFSFDYGFNQLLCAVFSGAALVVERSPLPQQISLALRRHGVTVLPCVPPLWLQLLGAADFRASPYPSLRAMTNTGGRVPTDAVRRLREFQPQARLFLMYGLTEAFRATYLAPEEVDDYPDSIGRAIPGSEILVLREDGSECGPNEEGELVQRGPTVAAGYWRDPELTAKVYRPNPRRPAGAPDSERVVFSGDVVRRDEAGRLFFVGRRDQLIKTMGYRVSPDEVCEVLYASGEVAEAVVGAEPHEPTTNQIIAYVVLRETGDVERLGDFCRRELPRYMQPARIVPLESVPRTTSGKFDAAAARARARDVAVTDATEGAR
jgi:amino acid adenylation domain-containing protein